MRFLFWIALALLVYFVVRSKLRSAAPKEGARRADPVLPDPEAMACCAHCHVYFPASESVRADGLDYCSPQHVRLPAE